MPIFDLFLPISGYLNRVLGFCRDHEDNNDIQLIEIRSFDLCAPTIPIFCNEPISIESVTLEYEKANPHTYFSYDHYT